MDVQKQESQSNEQPPNKPKSHDNRRDDYWIGFDLGGTKMLAALLDAKLRVVERKRRKTKGHEGLDVGLKRIVATIESVLKEADVDPKRLRGIGVGCPGPLDLKKGVIHEAPNLGWVNAPVKQYLEDAFHCPVVVANDVDAGVFGEYALGAAQGSHCTVGVFPGTGIGGGCVYQNRILQGKNSSCFEVGHIQVAPDGPLCGCGQQGCLESVASRLAIAAAAATAVFRGQAPHLREIAGTDVAEIRSGALAAAIEAGDDVIENIVSSAAEKIGVAVASLVHLVAPDTVVLGGGLVEAMPDLIVKTVRATARKRVLPSYKDTFKVVAAKLGDDATALGAASWARQLLCD